MSRNCGGLICTVCKSYYTQALSDLLQHIRLFHAHQPNLSIQCGIGGCQRVFTNFGTFQNHISGYHRSESNPTNLMEHMPEGTHLICDNDRETPNFDSERSDRETSEEDLDSEDEGDVAERSSGSELPNIQEMAALLLLKLKESHKLTQTALQGMIDGITTFWQRYLVSIQCKLLEILEEFQNKEEVAIELKKMLDPDGIFGHPFHGLRTHYQQVKYYKKIFGLIEPVRFCLGEKRVWKGIGRKRKCISIRDTMMYVPLLETIAILLKNGSIRAQIASGHQSTSGYMKDFCDGKRFQSHPLYSVQSKGLQIFMYYDDVEICNPLGSKRSIHKLGGNPMVCLSYVGFFYFTLGNLEPKYRSKLTSIQLLGIVKKSVLDSYGMNAILKPFVEDFKKLEGGYEFDIDGEVQLVYGTLTTVSADNPASSSLGGFKESASALRPCRHCLATREQTKNMFHESQFELRDPIKHKVHCTLIQGQSGSEHSKEYGINRESSLDSLSYFSTCNGGLLPDIMHDILEGALQYEVKLMLRRFIYTEKFFTCDYLGTKLQNMELGYMECKDRPTTITDKILHSADNKLHQNAAQMLMLAKLLPLAIGDLIPDDDEFWACFLIMMEIMSYLFSPVLSEDHAAYLQVLILNHHSKFREIYPNESVIPKMHYMIHMPRLIIQYGPLVRQWTMRYEAKHSYFKQLAQSMGNFIHIEYSLAMRHQLLHCYNHLEGSALFGNDFSLGPGRVISSSELDEENISITTAYKTKWIKTSGYIYQRGAAILINTAPTFARIEEIYLLNGKDIAFHVTSYVMDDFLHHLNAFSLTSSSSTFSFVMLNSLSLSNPMQVHKVGGKKLVTLPYHVDFD